MENEGLKDVLALFRYTPSGSLACARIGISTQREAAARAAAADDDIVVWPQLATRTCTSAPSVAVRPRERAGSEHYICCQEIPESVALLTGLRAALRRRRTSMAVA